MQSKTKNSKTILENEEIKLLQTIIEAIKEKKGKNIVKIDLRDIKSTLCDYFIICEGDSNVQVNALADNIEKQAYLQLNKIPHHIEGRENSQWILIDFFDIVVHVFQHDQRTYYKLEDLWSDGNIELVESD